MAGKNGSRNHADEDQYDFLNRKNKKRRTERNPLGAGRPSREAEEFEKWEQFLDNPREYVAAGLSKMFTGREGHDERYNSTSNRPNYFRPVEFILKRFLPRREVEKIDTEALDGTINEKGNILLDEILKKMAIPVAIGAGAALWYQLENINKKTIFTEEEWNNMSDNEKNMFDEAIRRTREILVKDTEEEEEYEEVPLIPPIDEPEDDRRDEVTPDLPIEEPPPDDYVEPVIDPDEGFTQENPDEQEPEEEEEEPEQDLGSDEPEPIFSEPITDTDEEREEIREDLTEEKDEEEQTFDRSL